MDGLDLVARMVSEHQLSISTSGAVCSCDDGWWATDRIGAIQSARAEHTRHVAKLVIDAVDERTEEDRRAGKQLADLRQWIYENQPTLIGTENPVEAIIGVVHQAWRKSGEAHGQRNDLVDKLDQVIADNKDLRDQIVRLETENQMWKNRNMTQI